MSSRWLLALLLVPLLSSSAYSQKLIDGFTREFSIQGLPTGFSLKSFDVTGDNVSELFVITSNQLWVFDGKIFSMIFKDSTAPGTNNLSPADVNRDGSMDLVANSKDTAVVVWYGPDFSSRRVFLVPQSGFGAFAARNREDGQIEFSFGFAHTHTSCTLPQSQCVDTTEGHILRFIDTTFIFFDSIHVDLSPTLSWEITSPGRRDLFLVGYYRLRFYPNFPHTITVLRVERLDGQQVSTLLSYTAVDDYESHCLLIPVLRAYSIGNIDTDTASELVAFADPTSTYPGCCCYNIPFFGVYDILTGIKQWGRTDLLGVISLFTVDLDGDGVQELLTYEIQNANPGLAEYRTSDGATLGFTELPFTPSTILMGQFGQPPAPKVLLGHGDSVVVFGIGCAANKGDMNADGNVTIFDVTLELNCAFLGTGSCNLCFADVNCDGVLSTSDVVLELLAVFMQRPFPCT